MAETKEERRARIEKEVAEASTVRQKAYFEAQAKSKAEAESKLAPLPKPDVYTYDYNWRQGVGTPEGEYKLTKTPNPLYDASTNEVVDPVTGVRTKVVMSKYGGSTQTGAKKTIVSSVRNADGTTTETYSDGTTSVFNPTGNSDSLYDAKRAAGYGMDTAGNQYRGAGNKTDPLTINGNPFTGTWQGKTYENGILVATSSSNGNTGNGFNSTTKTTYTAPDGRIFTDLASYNAYITKTAADEKTRKGQSAYDLLFAEFDRYGMGGLLNDVKQFIQDGLSKDELTLKLRATPAYQKRFAANAERIKKGFRAISEAEYIGLEDQYQNVMRQYGLPESYYTRGDMGVQQGFEKFIGGDVSAVELEDRIQTAQNRVINANPEVSKALREFYPEITGGDILAYALDPDKAITNIKRKVQAAEIGAGAMQAGLQTGLARAEELQRYGVTKETAQQGFGVISSGLERGRQLSNIYQQPTYTQQVAETEVFALPDADKARRQRRKLGQLETATFSGSTGMTGGALDRERAGQY